MKCPQQLEPLRTAIAGLREDPQNARRHSRRNLEAIADSLRQFGQQTPIVARKADNVVLKGNGTLAAARDLLGWTELAVVFVEMADVDAQHYALADNRTAELAEWDYLALARMVRELGGAQTAAIAGFGQPELTAMLERAERLSADAPARPKANGEAAEKDFRQLTLVYESERFQLLVAKLGELRESRKVESNAALVAALVHEECERCR